jgi:hypothetical protein
MQGAQNEVLGTSRTRFFFLRGPVFASNWLVIGTLTNGVFAVVRTSTSDRENDP